MSQLNAANQRTKRTDADNSYWDYAYDSLGQVTNAVRRWADGTLVAGQQYGYQFDDIGNRQRSEVSGQRSDYTANLLNQYTQRTVPGSVNLLGSAASNATVTVNGATATRQGEYFHTELALANTNAAAYSSIAITANMTSGTNNVTVTNTGHAFLPKTPEQFQHDADGNLTQDGRWQYTWDAENRLLAIETLPNLPTNVPVQKLMFQYDAQSRRISKVVSNFNGSTWTEISNLRFICDGWQCLAELDALATPPLPLRTYAWGLDLSGSPTGAGGIAGLLFGTFNGSSSTSSVAYAFDGNGNVTSLLDMRTGQLAAEYEYSPFGETIRATGPLAKENPFRFSTKRTDDTTGLIFYEHRILRPDIGRWFSRDPIGVKGGANVYVCLRNSLISTRDYLGLAKVTESTTEILPGPGFGTFNWFVKADGIKKGCELNFIQLALKGEHWVADVVGMGSNPPFYYNLDQLAGNKVIVPPDGGVKFQDAPGVETDFVVLAVERCCTEYFSGAKQSCCCKKSTASALAVKMWTTVGARIQIIDIPDTEKLEIKKRFETVVSGKQFKIFCPSAVAADNKFGSIDHEVVLDGLGELLGEK